MRRLRAWWLGYRQQRWDEWVHEHRLERDRQQARWARSASGLARFGLEEKLTRSGLQCECPCICRNRTDRPGDGCCSPCVFAGSVDPRPS